MSFVFECPSLSLSKDRQNLKTDRKSQKNFLPFAIYDMSTERRSDNRSRHSRHRQSRYRDFKSACVSPLNLISEHQQPRRLAPHMNSFPQDSQTKVPAGRPDRIRASFISLFVTCWPPHLRRQLCGRAAISSARSAFGPPREFRRPAHERLNVRRPVERFPSPQSQVRQSW